MTKLATIFLLATSAFAQQPGGRLQFDWDKLAAKATETVDLNLDPSMLQMASKFLSGTGDEAGIKPIIARLKGVFIKSFTFDKEGQYSEADVNAIRSQLRSPEWSKILEAHGKEETSLIYLKTDGLVIFAAEPKEFTVIQIIGPIDLSTLPALGGALGIPNMNFGPKPKAGTTKKKDD
jgi:hypothetical protein